MACVLAASLWVWASVFIAAATLVTKIPDHVQGVCEPKGTATEMQVITVSKEIVCAMLCAQRMAKKYTFNGTSCTLFGQTTLPVFAITTFHHFPSADTLEDVATGKPAIGSSLYDNNTDYAADKAVDKNETDNSMFASDSDDTSPWWLLDLGETRTIHDVQILSRRNCCPERFHDVEIRVGEVNVTNGDFSSYTLFATYEGPYTADQGRLTCSSGDGVRGTFVSIKKMKSVDGNNHLQIVDVNIFVLKENSTVH